MKALVRLALVLVLVALCAAAVAAAAGPAGAAGGSVVWSRSPSVDARQFGFGHCLTAPGGGVYVVGTRGKEIGVCDAWVVKYSPAGVKLWGHAWVSPYPRESFGADSVVDAAGNLYVCIMAMSDTGMRVFIDKYAPDGTLLWQQVVPDLGFGGSPGGMGLGDAGRLYVAAGPRVTPLKQSFATTYLDTATGAPGPTTQYSPGADSYPMGMAVTADGDCYVAGSYGASADGKRMAIVYKLEGATGAIVWHQEYGSLTASRLWYDVAVAPDGDVVVAGTTQPDGGKRDIAVARYTSTGERTWLRTWGSSDARDAFVGGLAVSSRGAAWVTGSNETGAAARAIALRWNAAGTGRVVRTVAQGKGGTMAEAVTVDAAGNAFVAGHVRSATAAHLVVAKYAPGGDLRWRHTGVAGGSSYLYDITLGRPGYLYACGGRQYKGLVVKMRR